MSKPKSAALRALTIFLIAMLSVAAVGLTVFLVASLNGGISFGRFMLKNAEEIAFDKTYAMDFSELSIRASAADVTISSSDKKDAHLTIYADDATEISAKDMNDQLAISIEGERCVGFCFGATSPRIELSLPESYAGKITVDNDYGSVELADFERARAEITDDYGSVTLGKILDAKVKNSCGDIKIGKVLEHLDIKNSMGSIEIGEIILKKNSRIENSMGSIKIERTNEIHIDAVADLGSVEIAENHDDAAVELTIKNSMGSIEVK